MKKIVSVKKDFSKMKVLKSVKNAIYNLAKIVTKTESVFRVEMIIYYLHYVVLQKGVFW